MLVASIAGQHSALRIRVWRALKTAGAAALRDGVYLVPASPALSGVLEQQRADVAAGGGSAYVLPLSGVGTADEAAFVALFDRSSEFQAMQSTIDEFIAKLGLRTETEARRVLRQLKRDLHAIEAIDFFPGVASTAASSAVREAEAVLVRTFSPDEPTSMRAAIARSDRENYRGRTWATRERLWIDRVASAWLIRRFIDPTASFVWLRRVSDCPPGAVGFDFDGADFTHVGDLVTFEVLLESFALDEDAALERLGALVHSLDVGGDRVPEAPGFEAMLTGARERCGDDDSLLAHVAIVLDDMYDAFTQTKPVAASVRIPSSKGETP